MLLRIIGKAHIAIGQNTHQLARFINRATLDHRHAGYLVALHQFKRIGQRLVGIDGERINHHAAFELLDGLNLARLFFIRHIAVKHAQTARLRHGNRQPALGDRIHGRRDDRQL